MEAIRPNANPPHPQVPPLLAPANAANPGPADNNRRAHDTAATAAVSRQWLKFFLVIFSGFLLGVVLGMLSTSLVFYFVPAPWLEHALKHRRQKLQEHLELRSMCRGDGSGAGGDGDLAGYGSGFIERYDIVENVVQICTCWPKGWGELGGWVVSCAKVEIMGYGEVGSWAD